MNDLLVMTKNYLIDHYFESQSMLLTIYGGYKSKAIKPFLYGRVNQLS